MVNTSDSASALLQDEVQTLLVEPVAREAVAGQVATQTFVNSHTARFPKVTADPTAAWTPEGSEITVSAPQFAEVIVTPAKVAGLTVCSNEFLRDASTEAIGQVGEGIVRDIARKVDEAFFGSLPSPAPAGLESLSTPTLTVSGGFTNVDWAEEAKAVSAAAGGKITNFVCHPSDMLALSKLKESASSNRGLLQSDPAAPAGKTVAGVDMVVSTAVRQGTIWAIPAEYVHLVIRQDAQLEMSREMLFNSDQVAIRGTMRVGFGFTHSQAIVKINVTA